MSTYKEELVELFERIASAQKVANKDKRWLLMQLTTANDKLHAAHNLNRELLQEAEMLRKENQWLENRNLELQLEIGKLKGGRDDIQR